MKKNAVILILFALLGTATAWYFLSDDGGATSTIDRNDRHFAVENIDEVQKIFIADRRGNQTTLERKGDHWIHNGKGKANPNILNNLLQVLKEVEIQFIPPSTAIEPMVQDLSSNGIKVELYNAAGEALRVYYVGGTTPDERGTYMIMEGSEQPYVTHLPRMGGGLRVRYNIWGERWRDKTVFEYTIEDIRSVSIEYPNQRNKSFRLFADKGKYEVEPFYDITPGDRKAVPKGIAESYLVGFERIVAEAFENENIGRDSISQLLPFAIITLQTVKGEEKIVELNPTDSRYATGELATPIIERYYAELMPINDFMLVQHRVFERILRPYNFFLADS